MDKNEKIIFLADTAAVNVEQVINRKTTEASVESIVDYFRAALLFRCGLLSNGKLCDTRKELKF